MVEEYTQVLINTLIKQRNECASRCAELEAKLIVIKKEIDSLKNKKQAEELFEDEE
tara:strand:+ start:1069 stop:1236 length:168 start_codon:yes stop_codon:yes gene_type:complete